MTPELFHRLAAPIPGDHPGGEDITFHPVYDDIAEARREDDASLSQGDWQTAPKLAQWPKVKALCESVLESKSKDLQVCCWYIEALTRLHGFGGLAFGFKLLNVIVDDFWEFAYPAHDDGLEERVGKIAWLNTYLPLTIRSIPLTSQTSGAYSWIKWEESRQVANLGLRDAAACDRAISDGKLPAEAFDKAATQSGRDFYSAMVPIIQEAVMRIAAVEAHLESRLASASPGLRSVCNALEDCATVVQRILERLGGTGVAEPRTTNGSHDAPAAVQRTAPAAVAFGTIGSRHDAVTALRQVAGYFRHNEPHSPVALLAERAARWAEMPLEDWLAAVVKDEATLSQLRELLDVRGKSAQ